MEVEAVVRDGARAVWVVPRPQGRVASVSVPIVALGFRTRLDSPAIRPNARSAVPPWCASDGARIGTEEAWLHDLMGALAAAHIFAPTQALNGGSTAFPDPRIVHA